MLVRELMRKNPRSCAPGTNLAVVTELLWTCGCGAVPVTDETGRVLGIITDRDICVATGTRNRRPADLRADEVMSRHVTACRATDDIHAALKLMGARRVRRLPVLDDAGRLVGVLCMSDLILEARHEDGSRPQLSYEDVMGALKSISWRHAA